MARSERYRPWKGEVPGGGWSGKRRPGTKRVIRRMGESGVRRRVADALRWGDQPEPTRHRHRDNWDLA